MARRTQTELIAMKQQAEVDSTPEIVPISQPENIPAHVWQQMQECGELATERLYEVLSSPSFHRMKASDKVKVIALAQARAYGAVPVAQTNKNVKGKTIDLTSEALANLADRSDLPEYKGK